jgi:uncharacterized protein YcfJ
LDLNVSKREESMKQAIKRGVAIAGDIHKRRPQEVRWSIAGMMAGALLGLLVGGVGIAAFGGARGVPAFLILGIVGGVIGNRVGLEKDRRPKS